MMNKVTIIDFKINYESSTFLQSSTNPVNFYNTLEYKDLQNHQDFFIILRLYWLYFDKLLCYHSIQFEIL